MSFCRLCRAAPVTLHRQGCICSTERRDTKIEIRGGAVIAEPRGRIEPTETTVNKVRTSSNLFPFRLNSFSAGYFTIRQIRDMKLIYCTLLITS
jgi:hypothetical protein